LQRVVIWRVPRVPVLCLSSRRVLPGAAGRGAALLAQQASLGCNRGLPGKLRE